eukprot:gnl/MRDRNA2_/MRDRNA2_81323_c0_seq1.p1 gnl/MRDRNA2_/MRDRNA2_81323_c0~~gnl/MRDRNA2_/MRDRNA2_81323_c0_seq1.p1  ORF type:complete len:141 (+),score=22.33 gnl/MRDRNA2_/MRDRNA2_81323_c0_seq1:90-512(+)
MESLEVEESVQSLTSQDQQETGSSSFVQRWQNLGMFSVCMTLSLLIVICVHRSLPSVDSGAFKESKARSLLERITRTRYIAESEANRNVSKMLRERMEAVVQDPTVAQRASVHLHSFEGVRGNSWEWDAIIILGLIQIAA